MNHDDIFQRLDYRRFVAWQSRLPREMPFLKSTFGTPGDQPLLDIACGTGEHAEAFRKEGYRVVGLDLSAAMLEKARAAYPDGEWVRGDMAAAPLGGKSVLCGAYCLGNSLAVLLENDHYHTLFATLRTLLKPGAPLVIQILNYRRILEKNIRHLPLNFRTVEPGHEVLYLRMLDPMDERRLRFEVLTLERRPPDGESRIVHQVSRVMRPLRDDELRALLTQAGFPDVEFKGNYQGEPFDPAESHDLIAVAR